VTSCSRCYSKSVSTVTLAIKTHKCYTTRNGIPLQHRKFLDTDNTCHCYTNNTCHCMMQPQ
jgi:hypothetical protein